MISEGKSFVIIGLLAAALRIVLFIGVSPQVLYDDHYEPANLILKSGGIPPPNACFECFQPPVFYLLGAGAKTLAGSINSSWGSSNKVIQGLNLVFALLLIPLLAKLTKRIKGPSWIRLTTFATLVFLPRIVLLTATTSNDMAAFVFCTAYVLALLRIMNERSLVKWGLVALIGCLAILTKSTSVVLFGFALPIILFSSSSWRVKTKRALLIIGFPLACFFGHSFWKSQYLKNGFALNIEIFQMELNQRPNQRTIWSFVPWQFWDVPLLKEGNMESLPTVLLGQLYVETEPKLSLPLLEKANLKLPYETHINYRDLDAEVNWKLVPPSIIGLGRIGLVLALIFFGICFTGVVRVIKSLFSTPMDVLGLSALTMLALNYLAIVLVTKSYPYYSFFKGAFMLVSIGAIGYLFFQGLRYLPRKWGVAFGCLSTSYAICYTLFLVYVQAG